MDEAVRETMPHEIQVGSCDESGFQQTMEVDGMPRYVRDLRSAVPPGSAPTTTQTFMSDDEERSLLPARR